MEKKTYNINPEEVLDRYLTFRKEDLVNYLALHGEVTLTAENVVAKLEEMMLSIGKKYFIMHADDPLVESVVSMYVKLLDIQQRKIAAQEGRYVIKPKTRNNDPPSIH